MFPLFAPLKYVWRMRETNHHDWSSLAAKSLFNLRLRRLQNPRIQTRLERGLWSTANVVPEECVLCEHDKGATTTNPHTCQQHKQQQQQQQQEQEQQQQQQQTPHEITKQMLRLSIFQQFLQQPLELLELLELELLLLLLLLLIITTNYLDYDYDYGYDY